MQTFNQYVAAHLASNARHKSFSRLHADYLLLQETKKMEHPLTDEQIAAAKAKHLAELEQRIADLEQRIAALESK